MQYSFRNDISTSKSIVRSEKAITSKCMQTYFQVNLFPDLDYFYCLCDTILLTVKSSIVDWHENSVKNITSLYITSTDLSDSLYTFIKVLCFVVLGKKERYSLELALLIL